MAGISHFQFRLGEDVKNVDTTVATSVLVKNYLPDGTFRLHGGGEDFGQMSVLGTFSQWSGSCWAGHQPSFEIT